MKELVRTPAPVIAMLVMACAVLGGCDSRPDTAEWRKTCIRSHSQTTTEVGTIIINGNVQSMVRPVTRQVCDEYASICVPGKDGTHRCPELEDNLD